MVLAAAFALRLWSRHLDRRSEESTITLVRLAVEGQGAEALRRLPAVEAAHPEPARLLLRLGQALDDHREAAAAVPLLERSLALDPSRAETRLALGRAVSTRRARWDARPCGCSPTTRRPAACSRRSSGLVEPRSLG